MIQKIVGFHTDQVGDWVADLSCGHTRHLRHNPPWQNRNWILSEGERVKVIGMEIDCTECDIVAAAGGKKSAEQIASEQKERRIAEAIKAECLRTAIESYTFAKMSGMCQEGAWEFAVDALKSMDVTAVLEELP